MSILLRSLVTMNDDDELKINSMDPDANMNESLDHNPSYWVSLFQFSV